MLIVDRIQERTRVLGPGERAVIWFHGCLRNCPGCIASGMNKSLDFSEYSVDELVHLVSSIDGIEGITISGGEPFQQDSGEMFEFLSQIKQTTKLSVMAYTGYLLNELQKDVEKARLLDLIDILVDGPYIEALDKGQLWRGSENQNIYFLTDRYSEIADGFAQKKGRPIECQIIDQNQFALTGVPPRGFRESLEKRYAEKGMTVRWSN